jgi:hypothetical protein
MRALQNVPEEPRTLLIVGIECTMAFFRHIDMSIATRQNEPDQIELLAAQRRLYSEAKTSSTLRTIIAVVLAVGGPLLTSKYPQCAAYVGVFSLAYLVFDIALLENMERGRRKAAAMIQELFDTRVLEISWNTTVVGARPDTDVIARALAKAGKIDRVPLRNWYSPEVADVPVEVGRVLCQRSNLSWDARLRTQYATALSVGLGLAVVVSIIVAVKLNMTLDAVLAGFVLPCVPLLVIVIRQTVDNFRSASDTRDLIPKIDAAIETLCSGKSVPHLGVVTRTFQDEIFRHRLRCPLIYDWVYWLLRDRQESEMRFSISEKVKECLGPRR